MAKSARAKRTRARESVTGLTHGLAYLTASSLHIYTPILVLSLSAVLTWCAHRWTDRGW